ncbi:MAG: glycosyltransferase WbuB [Alphaproteobacteria bacterium]|nr:glycosyltransferase WbuB [Alphaproteobacteria bacterium]
MTRPALKIVVHDYSGHPFQVELSRELARRGHRVHHCYSDSIQTPQGGLVRRKDDPDSFSVAPISLGQPVAKYSYVERWRQERRYGALLADRIAEHAPDMVLCGNGAPDIQMAALKAARRNRARFIFWLQDLYGEAAKRILPERMPRLGRVAAHLLSAKEARCLRQSDAVVAISDDFLPVLRQMGVKQDRCIVVENWAPLNEIAPRSKRNVWSLEQGCAEEFCFLYAGTLGLKHNPELLAALAETLAGDSAARVIVASQGLGAEYLAEQKKIRRLDRLTLLPFQPYSALPDMLGAADVAIALLEPEAGVFSVPSKVLSYFSAGRPLLAAMPRQNLAARLIERETAGLVVDPPDTAGFIAAASALRQDPARLAAMAAHTRAYAEQAFAIGSIADRFEALMASRN